MPTFDVQTLTAVVNEVRNEVMTTIKASQDSLRKEINELRQSVAIRDVNDRETERTTTRLSNVRPLRVHPMTAYSNADGDPLTNPKTFDEWLRIALMIENTKNRRQTRGKNRTHSDGERRPDSNRQSRAASSPPFACRQCRRNGITGHAANHWERQCRNSNIRFKECYLKPFDENWKQIKTLASTSVILNPSSKEGTTSLTSSAYVSPIPTTPLLITHSLCLRRL